MTLTVVSDADEFVSGVTQFAGIYQCVLFHVADKTTCVNRWNKKQIMNSIPCDKKAILLHN